MATSGGMVQLRKDKAAAAAMTSQKIKIIQINQAHGWW